MMESREFKLLPFQLNAVEQTVEAVYRYDGSKNIFTAGTNIPEFLEGSPKPYLHRIKAITGAGKTPILASVSSRLKDCIILWTTPRGAIIEQTTQNLKGKYNPLLNSNSEVMSLDEALNNASWNRLIGQERGSTIITTTVARFNQQDGNNLNIHKGDPSPWEQLCNEAKRPIWVFYDEGHNATENQFNKLLELQPKGFILASASPLSPDLQILLPGEDKKAKESELNNNRSTIIDTKQVVNAGLLKRTIEIHDLETGDHKILEAAYKKREYLESISDNNIVACYMVDRNSDGTGVLHGLHIWEQLISLGADPKTIAVHLQGAKKVSEIEAKRGKPYFRQLVPTYDEQLTPEDLKKNGFKHLIWNLSLEEGWDEPWAYVGYFHGKQANERKITQRIGRLVRNPFKNNEGLPSLAPEIPLRSVYCYLNSSDEVLKAVVERLQDEMNTSGLEVMIVKNAKADKETEVIKPKINKSIPRLCLNPDYDRIERELFDTLFKRIMNKQAYLANGSAVTLKFNVGDKANIAKKKRRLKENAPTTVAEIIKSFLEQRDPRLIRRKGSVGCWISPLFWRKPELLSKIYYTSEAYYEFKRRSDKFIEKMDRLISLELDNDQEDPFIVDVSTLINPNGGTAKLLNRYKVHSFNYSIHSRYNGFNSLELGVAKALDQYGATWFRNPSRSGYGIPLTQPDNSSTMFYPDFIAWKGKEVYFIEAKGAHLVDLAKKEKLKMLPRGFSLGMITQEQYEYKLIRRGNKKVHESTGSLLELLQDLMDV